MEENKLDICRKTRKWAAKTLVISLRKLLKSGKSISEVDFRDSWLSELRKNPDIFPDGWYIPPPYGVTVLFSSEDDTARTNFESFRWEKYWPSQLSYFIRNKGILVAYASLVDRKTITIGDFGLTLYFGKNRSIKNHFRNILDSQKNIFDYAKIGMSFKEVYGLAEKIFKKMKLSNDWWLNITDPSGRNIGHTIPGIFEGWSKKETDLLNKTNIDWQRKADIISKKRIFISPPEKFIIQPNSAFTIEHRLKSSKNLPVIWFHTIAIFDKNGKKELLTDFDEIFALTNMNYMFK